MKRSKTNENRGPTVKPDADYMESHHQVFSVSWLLRSDHFINMHFSVRSYVLSCQLDVNRSVHTLTHIHVNYF